MLFNFWIGGEVKGQATMCGFDEVFQPVYQANPVYFEEMELELQEMINTMGKGQAVTTDVVIPVVFHVIHEGEDLDIGGNIPNAQIQAALTSLNADFMGSNIQFCLAKRDPEGNALVEEGVQRVDGSAAIGYNGDLSISGNEYDIKGLSYFTNFRYLNIWVVDNIISSGSGQVLGFATFPGSTASIVDGIVMDKDFMGVGNWHVLTHEVGHFLNLYHTFQGDDPDYDGQNLVCPPLDPTEGDMCEDTQAHIRSSSGSCPSGNNGCYTSGPIPQLEDVTDNHMDYSDETCRNTFTDDQIERMQACLMTSRRGLTTSLGCIPACNPNFSVDFSKDPDGSVLINTNVTFEVENPIGNYSYEWYLGGEAQQTSSSFTTQFSESGIYTICLNAFDSNNNDCPNENCKQIFVVSNAACSNEVLPPCELLLNGGFDQFETSNDDPIILDFCVGCPDVICNWYGSNGSPFFCQEDKMIGLWSSTLTNESIRTLNKVNLIDNAEYMISFNYEIASDVSPIGDEVVDFELGFVPENDILIVGAQLEHRIAYFTESMSVVSSNNSCDITPMMEKTFNFTYDASMGDHMYIMNAKTSEYASILYIKNISITECCMPDPTISFTQTDQCTFNFTFDSGVDEGTMYWTIESGPSGVEETHTQSFVLEGEYEVCLHAQCEGNDVVECIRVYSEGCEIIDCNGVFVAFAGPECPGDETSTINFSLSIPSGYGPCGEELYITPEVNYTDYFFDPSTGLLMVSANVDDPSQIFTLVVCGPDGTQLCYTVGGVASASNKCDECIDISVPVIATCDDPDGSDINFSYSGTFSITPPPGATPCGNSSSAGGFSLGNPSTVGQVYTFPFTINTNNPNPFATDVTVCFYDDVADKKTCYNIRVSVLDPCVPTKCIEIENTFTIKCDRVDNGVAIFEEVSHVLFIQDVFRDGYELCEDREVSLDNGAVSLDDHYATPSQNGYVTITSLEIPCDEIGNMGQTTMTLNFCNDNGEEFCVDLILNLECDGCPGNRIEGRDQRSDADVSEIEIFPNPVNDYVTIRSGSDAPNQSFTLMDMTGKVLLNEGLIKGYNTISTLDYAGGIYYIHIEKDGLIENHKILIVK